MTRKDFLLSVAAAPVAAAAQPAEPKVQRKNRLKQGVCPGVFGRNMPFEDRARHAARLGAHCFDLQGPQNWPILKKYGLVPTVVPGGVGAVAWPTVTKTSGPIRRRSMPPSIWARTAAGC